MEYGYEITDTAGGQKFFVEGCTCCHMSTAGVHELGCPCRQEEAKGVVHSIYNILYSVWQSSPLHQQQ